MGYSIMFFGEFTATNCLDVPIFSQTSLNALPNLSRENRRQPSGLESLEILYKACSLPAFLFLET